MLRTTACTGASQAGSRPAWCSSRIAKKRSSEPNIARCSMTGVRLLAVLVDVIGAQALGHVQVDLQRAALPVPADGIAQHELELRAVEGALALVQGVLDAGGRGGGLEGGLGPVPDRRPRPPASAGGRRT